MAAAGDVNGDNVPDAWVGSYLSGNPVGDNNRRGALYLLYLESDGEVLSWNRIDGSSGFNSGVMTDSLSDRDYFGKGITRFADPESDCIFDLLVGTHRDDEETAADGPGTTSDEGSIWLLKFSAVVPSRESGDSPILEEIGDLNKVKFYPNPTNRMLHIKLETEAQEEQKVIIQIFSLVGQKVHEWHGFANDGFLHTADLKTASTGQYLVKMVVGKEVFTTVVSLSR